MNLGDIKERKKPRLEYSALTLSCISCAAQKSGEQKHQTSSCKFLFFECFYTIIYWPDKSTNKQLEKNRTIDKELQQRRLLAID
jgi:hypothetical protein